MQENMSVEVVFTVFITTQQNRTTGDEEVFVCYFDSLLFKTWN